MSEQSPEDRRARARQKTNRPAQCFGQHANQALAGRVTNVSAGGLQLALSRELAPGKNWEVEVAAKKDRPGEPPILVRAEVLWHRLDDDGTHTHGMRLHMPLDRNGATVQLRADDAARRMADFRDALVSMSRPGDLMPLARPLEEDSGEEPADASDWKRHALVVLLLLLFLGTLATCMRKPGGDSDRRRQSYQPGRSESERPPADVGKLAVTQPALDGPAGRMLSLDQAYHAFLQGDHARAENLLGDMDGIGDLTPVERFLVRAAHAQMTYADGRTGDGIAEMRAALAAAPEALPAVWRAAGEEMLSGLPQSLAGTVPLWGLYRSATLSEASPNDDDGNVRVEIDLSDFLLRVYRDDQLAAVLPVGIGEMNETPVGWFRIANKLKNPVWYNRGHPVAPDDPKNPLGDLWLGLGKGGHALPIGLHPTGEPDSIGAARSAGCIRLRPEDAARLDALCEVGTPVRIVP